MRFVPKSEGINAVGNEQRIYEFANGYGASVIRGPHTYGGPEYFEVAVLRGGHICYDTPITDDVIGWLTEEMVQETLGRIAALTPAHEAGGNDDEPQGTHDRVDRKSES